MNKYESLYIISTQLNDEAIAEKVKKFTDLITSNGGVVSKVDTEGEWGRRKLAYPINFETEGYYVLVTFEADSELPKELERNYKNDESVMRFVVVNLEA